MSNVLVIGGGGREHALAWKLSQSENVANIFVSPGNPGTFSEKNTQNIDLPINEHEKIAVWCKTEKIDLVVVGPEVPLADGISDVLSAKGVDCFGPSKLAAQIESSKFFSKKFMEKYNIPTAKWKSFTDSVSAVSYINSYFENGVVVKASGLAAGKGVVVTESKEVARNAVFDMIEKNKFGSAGATVLIEEKLCGEEMSVLAFSDGKDFVCFPPAQDFKSIYENGQGPNTGGMGCYAPFSHVSSDDIEFVHQHIMKRTIDGMREEGCPFVGILYAGLMLTKNGPKVLEFNCRFGDPETQVLLPLLNSDLYSIMKSCCAGKLDKSNVTFKSSSSAVCVVLASKGYPGTYQKNIPISGLLKAKNIGNSFVFHSGTRLSESATVTLGGRVLGLTGIGENTEMARNQAYQMTSIISFENMVYRTDIAKQSSPTLSYADAGVNIKAGEALVRAIKPISQSTNRSGCIGGFGGFGGLFDMKAIGYTDPILVSGTDGVGTKLKVAIECNSYNTIGVDLVAMCVNDILAHGAEPLFFLDYYACAQLNISQAEEVIKGIADGCRQAGCALLGGETAEMPGIYNRDDYDLAGFAVGAVNRSDLLPKFEHIQAGDMVIGLPSSGVHSNGFSLIRKVMEMTQYKYSDKCPFVSDNVTMGDNLLTPTMIYVNAVLPLMKRGLVKAFAHITGGGIKSNLKRVMPSSVRCVLDARAWRIPGVFGWIAKAGGVSADEMLNTFNCGVGAVLIVSAENRDTVMAMLKDESCVIGTVESADDAAEEVCVRGFDNALASSYDNLALDPRPKERIRVACLISGSGTNLQALLDHCSKPNSSAEIVLVISNVANVKGLERALTAGIKTKVISHKSFATRVDFEMEMLEELRLNRIELVCLAGFMRILTGVFVREWKDRLLNIHPSLLPSFKGHNAHEKVLEAGVKVTGCTVHYVVEEVDAGGIISQGVVSVAPGDTVDSLQDKVKKKEWEIYPEAVELVARQLLKRK